MSITLTALQKQRRDTAANWTSANPTLLAGEIGLESDTGYWKVGDGSTAWTSLAYVSGLGAEIPVSRLADGSARQLLQTAANGTDVEWTSNVDVPGTLDVTSTATFDSIASHPLGSAAAPTLTFTGDPNTGIYSPGADQVAISTGGSGRLFVDSTGRVGIGTSSISTISERVLHIYAGAGASSGLRLTGNAGTGLDLIHGTDGNGYLYQRDNAFLAIGTNNQERLRVTAGGLVGIGTTNPLNKLVVSHNNGAEGIEFLPGYTSNRNITFHYNRSTSAYAQNDQIASAHIFRIASDSTQAAIIDSSGNVGIGTSSPSFPLHVAGGRTLCQTGNEDYSLGIARSGATNAYYLGVHSSTSPNLLFSNNAGTTRMVLTDGGSLGIGTTSPSYTLDVNGTGRFANNAALYWNDSGGTARRTALLSNGNSFYFGDIDNAVTNSNLIFTANANAWFVVNGSERARIDGSGRLLVGTSSVSHTTTVVVQGNTSSSTGAGYLSLRRGETATSITTGEALGVIDFRDSDGNRYAEIYAEADAAAGSNDYPGRLVFSTTADGASSPTERMWIRSNGEINMGANNGDPIINQVTGFSYGSDQILRISRSSATCFGLARRTTDGSIMDFHKNATIVGSVSVTGTATAYNTSSDYRLKENISPVTDGITRLQQLKPSRFNFIADPSKTVDGFLAHEAAEVVPECVTGEKDAVDDDGKPIYQGIDQSKLVPLLTAALQEAVAKIESLEARLTAAGV